MNKFKKNKYRFLSIISSYSFVLIIIISIFTPHLFVKAADPTINAAISNPLGTTGPQNIPDFIKKILEIVLTVGIPLLVLAVIYAGFLYVKAQGNPGELEVAHRTLLYTVIGGALLLGAFVIANAIGSTVKEIGNNV